MFSFEFWCKWMVVVAWIVIATGFELAFLNQTFLFAPINDAVNAAFWGAMVVPDTVQSYQQLVYGLFGSVTVGWGVMILFIVNHAFSKREQWAWKAIAYSVAIWYVLDTGFNLWFGTMAFVIINTVLLAALVPPMFATARTFTSRTGRDADAASSVTVTTA